MALAIFLSSVTSAWAENTVSAMPSRGLQNAIATNDNFNLYDGNRNNGLVFSGGFFSGSALGIDSSSLGSDKGEGRHLSGFDSSPELIGDQQIYAMMIDGRYDFNVDQLASTGLHPYIMSGLGVAHYGQNQSALTTQAGDTMPLFRMGGGVTYRLGPKWDLSLDYKAGISPSSDQLFTVRNQQAVDLQVLNMGMHYQF